jgi:DNA repair exonuclease SbcCD nuclease subunit
MKVLLLGDLHLTDRAPERRKDNYCESQMFKFMEVLSIYKETGCQALVQCGDFFDYSNVGNGIISDVIDVLRKEDVVVFAIYGQHDISGHSFSTFYRSPLRVLQSAGVVNMIPAEGVYIGPNVICYGASFGEEVPIIEKPDGRFNILVIHAMIGDSDLYPGQDITKPNSFLEKYPCYDLCHCGDYHYPFIERVGKRMIVNSGCLMRKTISERDLQLDPGVVVVDTAERLSRRYNVYYDPIDTVFDLVGVENKGKEKVDFAEFVNKLKSTTSLDIGWRAMLSRKLRSFDDSFKTKVDNIIVKALETKSGKR